MKFMAQKLRDGATIWWKLRNPNFNRFNWSTAPMWQTDGRTRAKHGHGVGR